MSIPIPSSTSTCLVTGASAGIGTEFARQLAERGYNVTLAARRIERLTELAAELEETQEVRALAVACDVTDPAQRRELIDSIHARGDQIDILVNNAGIGAEGYFADQPEENHQGQIDVNVSALTALTSLVLPHMIEAGSGAILNVASTAAFQPIPRQAVYAATKAYVSSFSQALAQELRPKGVTVTVLCPGPTRTEFFGDKQDAIEGGSPGWAWQTAEECARDGLEGLFKQKRVVIPRAVNRAGALSAKYSPTRVTVEVLDRFWPMGRQ
jgi:short-subunit dehydrogenase